MVDGARSVHRRKGISMVSTKQLTAVLNGITTAHVKERGADSLLPERKNPIGPALTLLLLSTPEGTILGSKALDWLTPLCTSLRAMFALSAGTG